MEANEGSPGALPGKQALDLNTEEDEEQIMGLRPAVLEQLQRHNIWRHLHPDMYVTEADNLTIGFYYADAVYAPLETVFLRHGRLSGHRTLNGKGMNVCQAADGFFNRIMAAYLSERGLRNPETYTAIRDFMYGVW